MIRKASLLVAAMLAVAPAWGQTVNLAGPWFVDFPQGRGTVILQGTGGSPPKYQGTVTIPHPSYPKGLTFQVTLLSAPSYVVPGNDLTFQPNGTAVQFFMMNVSSGSSGVAWIVPGPGSDNHLLKYHGVKAPAHR